MVKICYWNVRGACHDRFLQNLRLLCRKNNPGLILLSETKCEEVHRLRRILDLGFDDLAFVPSVGRSGGIVVAWKKDWIEFRFFH